MNEHRRRLGALAVLAVGLVASASTADGNCAWILWSREVRLSSAGVGAPEWRVHASHKTEEECMHAVHRATAQESGKGSRGTLTVLLTGESIICLPDTIDPRRAKAP
jgi:hypothetical protein